MKTKSEQKKIRKMLSSYGKSLKRLNFDNASNIERVFPERIGEQKSAARKPESLSYTSDWYTKD